MLTKRIIPCLDVKDGRVVKGVQFVELRDAGDPVEAAEAYDAQGADELTFLDITASHEKRGIILDVVRPHRRAGLHAADRRRRRARDRRHPQPAQCRGGQGVDQHRRGASPRVRARGGRALRLASASSSPSTPAAFPAPSPARWEVYTHGGRNPTGIDAMEWAARMESYGAGEILLTSMDKDGTKDGYDSR